VHEDNGAIPALPGFVSLEDCIDDKGRKCTGVTVESASSDLYLRYVLDTGGSVISVEPRSGIGSLQEWMDPADVQKGGTG
jgi:hypothetical protein